MKHHIDELMRQNDASALWISGAANHNPSMVYLTGGVHLTMGDLFYKPGQTPVLCHGGMERDEAAKTGYQLINYSQYDYRKYLEAAGQDRLEAQAQRYADILRAAGVTDGKVLLYGMREFGPFFSLVRRLQELLPGITFSGDLQDAILLEARATKGRRRANSSSGLSFGLPRG